MKWFIVRYKFSLLTALLGFAVAYYFCLPTKLFKAPYSAVLVDQDNELLSASIAHDGQWRFPAIREVPEKFEKALILYEDKRFWGHPGIDMLSLGRALKQNIKAGRIVSGGSTIDMQVIRLSRKGKPRTFFEKGIELILATRLQWRYSKKEILTLYASHAPFGGNVVGLEAACWRYFGREPNELSWAEAVMLAVLPNAPSLIHISKNRDALLEKRNRLLARLKKSNVIDALTYTLAIQEPIPNEPFPLPRHARHLLTRAVKEQHSAAKITSTIQAGLQQQVEQVLNDHHQRLKGNQIFNLCALVVEVETGKVLAYAGNVGNGADHGADVDVITSSRSTGSILKPFLYAAMIDDGRMLPKTLLPDIPTVINGFAPKNFSREYDGAVPADQALIRSLNIPAVFMLREYRYERFHHLLKAMGMSTLRHQPDHYGLSLILGGAEGTLWDITGMYASMARTLNHYFNFPGKNRYRQSDFRGPHYLNHSSDQQELQPQGTTWLSAAAIYQTFEALKEVYRPGEETGWKFFSSSKKIAWKTGTSFGFRDGWAVGVTPHYAVGVWVGNADGEGRPGLTGTETAAPVMFDIFSKLPTSDKWFRMPLPEMQKAVVCAKSGSLISDFCEVADTVWITKSKQESLPCTYHKKIHVSANQKFRVHSGCETVEKMKHVNWFVLPPVQEYYFKSKHLSYKPLPPLRSDCSRTSLTITAMELVYPKPNARIFIPRDLNGVRGSTVFELAHRNATATVYWHLDGEFAGETRRIHQMPLNPSEGKHLLTIVDDSGEIIERHFEVISKR